MLEVDDLVKRYGRFAAVDGMSFAAPTGQLVCLLGPNGAGKSTTMRTIAGLQLCDGGRIVVGGKDVSSDPLAARKLVGITPQDVALFDHLTVRETLDVVAELRGIEAGEASRRADHWIEATMLSHAKDRLARELSGGMKRKLGVACAMIHQPPVVILDESFVGLDPESVEAIRLELRRYCDGGGTVLLSSHQLELVRKVCRAARSQLARRGARAARQRPRRALHGDGRDPDGAYGVASPNRSNVISRPSRRTPIE
jgi:ABC-2 type transport system ATP-binding protein